MGTRYGQLSLEERCTIAELYKAGQSIRQIASVMARAPSTVAREIKRNISKQQGYQPVYAWEQAKGRRWKGSRLERQPDLRNLVLDRLAMGYSPEQVAGRLALEQDKRPISYESIYRFIYAQIRRTKDYSWRRYLPKKKSKRGHRRSKGKRSPTEFIKNRTSIHERPKEIEQRKKPGHWEADLMLFSRYGQALLVLHERTSRFLVLQIQEGKGRRR